MAWTAKLKQLMKLRGEVNLVIEYSDGTDRFLKKYRFDRATKADIRRTARQEVARIAAVSAEVLDLPLDINIDLTEPVKPTPEAPTAAQIARSAWLGNWGRLNALLRLVDAGLLASDDSRIQPLRDKLTTDWLNSYLGSI